MVTAVGGIDVPTSASRYLAFPGKGGRGRQYRIMETAGEPATGHRRPDARRNVQLTLDGGARDAQANTAATKAISATQLVTADAVSLQLGVPTTWVRASARRGDIPHVRLGHYVRFDPLAVELWWRARAAG